MTTQRERDEVFAVLRESRILSRASDEGVRGLAARARIRAFDKGDLVAREGEPAEGFGFILEGSIPSYQLAGDGEHVLYKAAGRGDNVGLPPVLAGVRYPFFFEALTPSRLAWFTRNDIMELLEDEPPLAIAMLSMFSGWLVETLRANRNLSLDVPSRLANYLFGRSTAIGRQEGEDLTFSLGIYKSDLATYLDTVPETLSRAFGTLSKAGLISLHGRTVTVLDLPGLAKRGEGISESVGQPANERRK